MAKTKDKAKKDKAGKGKAASTAGKLPKRIAGVKVPKELRKSGAKVVDALSHPLIADVAAAALMAAAAALRDDKGVRSGVAKVRGGAGSLGSLVADAAQAGIRHLKAMDSEPPLGPSGKPARPRKTGK